MLINYKNMCIFKLLGYCIHQISVMWQVHFLGSEHIFINKTKIHVFCMGETKITRQLNEMCSVIVIRALEKNERRKIGNIEVVNIRLL